MNNNESNKFFCPNCGKENVFGNDSCINCKISLNSNQQVINEINQENTTFSNQNDLNPKQSNNQTVEQKQPNYISNDSNSSSKKISGLIILAFIDIFLLFASMASHA